jgi:hypothetical protein
MKCTRSVLMNMAVLACLVLAESAATAAGQVAVRFPEGATHGVLVVRSLNNKEIGSGGLTETVDGERVTSKLALHFNDGSIYEETTQFTQGGMFHVLDYHLVQKGPAFRQSLEMTIDVSKGTVTVRSADGGKEKVWTRHMHIPQDLANGIVPFLVRNMPSDTDEERVSMIVATPEPKLVQLTISPMRSEVFPFDGSKLQATRYAVRADLSGIVGSLVKITGRQPPPSFIWMLRGKVPSFLMAQEDLVSGPVCRIELTAPLPPTNTPSDSSS